MHGHVNVKFIHQLSPHNHPDDQN